MFNNKFLNIARLAESQDSIDSIFSNDYIEVVATRA